MVNSKIKPPRRVRLKCACCGGDAGYWVQHWNRDKGYGICTPCVSWITRGGAKQADIEESYGKRGINWGNEEDG